MTKRGLLMRLKEGVYYITPSEEKEGIHTVFRRSAEGLLYGITYVDHKTKSVFNGSNLGKEFSAKAIQERCSLKVTSSEKSNKIY